MSVKYKSLLVACVFSATLSINTFSQPKWAPQISGTSNSLRAVAFFDSSDGIATDDSGYFLHTNDGGVNWSQELISDLYTKYIKLTDIAICDAYSAIIVGNYICMDAGCGAVFRTSNRGMQWDQMDYNTGGWPSVSFANSMAGIIYGYGWNFAGQLYTTTGRTTDGGVSWQSYVPVVDNNMMRKIITDVAYVDTTFCISISDDGCVFRMIGDSMGQYYGISYWELIDSLSTRPASIHFVDTTTGYIAGDGGKIYQTTDGGQSWHEQISGMSRNLRSVYFLSGNEGYVAGDFGTILHTTDGGNNWMSETSGTTQNLNKIFFTDSQHGWVVGENGTILKYGEFAACYMSRTEIDFGEIIERETVMDSVLLSNTGTEPLTVSNIQSDFGEFSPSQNNLNLAAGETKTINVSFHPMSPGLKTGHIIFTHNAQSSPDTLLLYGVALNVDTTTVEVQTNWNLVANPRIVPNDSVHILFNSAISPAYQYDQIEGYQSVQRMLNGIGYWLKFGSPQSINLLGVDILIDTIDVNEGWNLIGSISKPVETSTIMQNPPGIVITDYFTYDSGYIPSNTLIPGKAYWAKVSQNGKLILTAP